MKELSLHVLDIVQNSIAADANLITIRIVEKITTDRLVIEIADNGRGMDNEMVQKLRIHSYR